MRLLQENIKAQGLDDLGFISNALEIIKDNLKKVHIVRLFTGHPPVNKNVSRALMALADRVIDLYESEIRKAHLL